MAYSDFSVEDLLEKFSLSLIEKDLFNISIYRHASHWLIETLAKGRKFALTASSEKAKSEFIIAPTLLEIEGHYPEQIAIYSGKNLDAERTSGLYGKCDFIIGKGAVSTIISTPIIAMVESKRDNLESDLGRLRAMCSTDVWGNNLQPKPWKADGKGLWLCNYRRFMAVYEIRT